MTAEPADIVLRHGRFSLGLSPRLGGSITFFSEDRPEGLRHWFRPASPAALSAADGHMTACFPLVPVSGRIADARFRKRGRDRDNAATSGGQQAMDNLIGGQNRNAETMKRFGSG